ncbi:uncharacterized protein LOC107046156 [Diachasma alloeum]|uniref:uncharacterized protein LOC107046156 n=1 Tax=Diachasma alloeum TaxID=454923 RepID=UPI00073836EB|nr:uncharacterized protein LOC107046156 [Diachasma alloeum]
MTQSSSWGWSTSGQIGTSNYQHAISMLQEPIEDLLFSEEGVPLLIGGDWNARVGIVTEVDDATFEGTSLFPVMTTLDTETSDRCTPTLNLMSSLGMTIINGRTTSDYPANFTYSRLGESINDTIWCSAHSLQTLPPPPPPNFPLFRQAPNSLQQTYDRIVKVIWEGARSVGLVIYSRPSVPSSTSGSQGPKCRNPWFDDECVPLKAEIKRALKQCFVSRFDDADKLTLNTLKKNFKLVTENKKKLYEKQIIDSFANLSNPNEFWAAVKRLKPTFGLRDCGLPIEVWNSFYRNIYPPRSLTFDLPSRTDIQELDREISLTELETAIKHLKNAKAPGLDGITNEALKALTPEWTSCLLTLFNNILCAEEVPPSWAEVVLSMIFKKGDKDDPGNYRGIALVNTTTKLFTEILRKRLENWTESNGLLPES